MVVEPLPLGLPVIRIEFGIRVISSLYQAEVTGGLNTVILFVELMNLGNLHSHSPGDPFLGRLAQSIP
jgi:hypothetical protein